MARNRYGRNQKRKHREEIARLKAEVQTLILWERAKAEERRNLDGALAAQRREMEGLVEEIRAVCRDSALLPPREVSLPGHGPWVLTEPSFPRTRWVPVYDSVVEPMIATVDVYEVRAYLESHSNKFRKFVCVKLPDREIRFAVSCETIRAFGRYGLRQMAENLFSMLWGALRKEEELP